MSLSCSSAIRQTHSEINSVSSNSIGSSQAAVVDDLNRYLAIASPEHRLNTLRYMWGENVDGYAERELVDKAFESFNSNPLKYIEDKEKEIKKSSLFNLLGDPISDSDKTKLNNLSKLSEFVISKHADLYKKFCFSMFITENLRSTYGFGIATQDCLRKILNFPEGPLGRKKLYKEATSQQVRDLKQEAVCLSEQTELNQKQSSGVGLEFFMATTSNQFNPSNFPAKNLEQTAKNALLITQATASKATSETTATPVAGSISARAREHSPKGSKKLVRLSQQLLSNSVNAAAKAIATADTVAIAASKGVRSAAHAASKVGISVMEAAANTGKAGLGGMFVVGLSVAKAIAAAGSLAVKSISMLGNFAVSLRGFTRL